MHKILLLCFACMQLWACDEENVYDTSFRISHLITEGGMKYDETTYSGVVANTPLKLRFTEPVDNSTVEGNIRLMPADDEENELDVMFRYESGDSVVALYPQSTLDHFSKYKLNVWQNIRSKNGTLINTGRSYTIITAIDSTDKYTRIPREELLDKIQRHTFRYFWENGHKHCGMALERNNSNNTVTTGGTGFGIMAMITATERNFITRSEAYERVNKIVSFLKNECTTFHGAFSHWIDGSTGTTLAFSPADNGADLVETSFLMQGLLVARQYFDRAEEETLRNDITALWEDVEWSWFNRNHQNILYWNWSPDFSWEVNLPIRGWNEALITYILAAASPTYAINKEVYDTGWAQNGNMMNRNRYYGHELPAGPEYGGPLFFSHYSFLGLNPEGLGDAYINDYWEQNRAHALINFNYCKENPKRYLGYSADCWGLTASDGNSGYSAHSPTNDRGVIAPTAALASMPYTPDESIAALEHFYYKLGDHLWDENGCGFYDAFNLSERWFDNQYLAIDQGPIIVMIENYRSKLIWELFMEIPEVQKGLRTLGFSSPYLK